MYQTQNQHQTAKQGHRCTARRTQAAAHLANTRLMQRREREQAGIITQRQTNQTGLPDNLKSGMENLSGMSLDHVRVHRNSSKPAAVQAHAYAQGSEIHLAGGQEHHLPHELGHVVQQMQGRVKPTTSIGGMAVNDNAGLESEATAMGTRALQRAVKGVNGRRRLTSLGTGARRYTGAVEDFSGGKSTNTFISPSVNQQRANALSAQWTIYDHDNKITNANKNHNILDESGPQNLENRARVVWEKGHKLGRALGGNGENSDDIFWQSRHSNVNTAWSTMEANFRKALKEARDNGNQGNTAVYEFSMDTTNNFIG